MNRTLKIILLILALITVISTASYCSAPYDTETAQITNVRTTIEASGIILRRETVIQSSTSGVFEASAKDGARVSKGNPVGIVISGNLNKELTKELEEVTKRIDEIKQSDSIADIYSSDEARIFSAMRDLSSAIRRDIADENYSSAAQNTIQLDTLIQKKYSVENAAASDKLLVELEEQKYRLEQQLGGIREEVLSPASGYFSSTLDGLEGIGSEKDISLITPTKINEFSETLEAYTPNVSDPGKIIDTYVWYIAASVPREKASGLKAGDSVTLSVDESPFVKASVLAVNEDATDAVAVILRCDRNITGVYEKRSVQFEVCLEEYTGLYVPAAAIRVVDDVTGVYVMSKNDNITFKCVKILFEDDAYYIVDDNYTPGEDIPFEPLGIYDNILVNPEVTRLDDKSSKQS